MPAAIRARVGSEGRRGREASDMACDPPRNLVNVKGFAPFRRRAQGDFALRLANGGVVKAENVILALGTQGNPNLVRCPVDDGAVVQYQLDDPGEYVDEHIIVIGAGDAGIENALGLAADPEQRNA